MIRENSIISQIGRTKFGGFNLKPSSPPSTCIVSQGPRNIERSLSNRIAGSRPNNSTLSTGNGSVQSDLTACPRGLRLACGRRATTMDEHSSNASKSSRNTPIKNLLSTFQTVLSNHVMTTFKHLLPALLLVSMTMGRFAATEAAALPMRWTPMFGHLRGKLSYNGLLVWVSISSRAEGQVLAPQLFYFGRRNGRVSMQRNVVKWNTDPGMKTSKTAAGAIDLHAAFSLVPSLIPLSYMALGVSLPRAS